jgi:surface-anchored protein
MLRFYKRTFRTLLPRLSIAWLLMAWIGCDDGGEGEDVRCDPGFTLRGGSCEDIDECAEGTAVCSGRAACSNLVGSYTCPCPTGWVSSGSSCQLQPCKYRYKQGHGDLYVSWAPSDGMTTAIRSALEGNETERLYPTYEVCIDVPRASYLETVDFGGRPPGVVWDQLGVVEGAPFWYLPEVAIEARPWFGLASDPGELGGVPVDALEPTLSLAVQVEGPPGGELSMWVSGGPDEIDFRLSTFASRATTSLITSSHAHFSWGFSLAGEYLVTVQVSGVRRDTGANVSSPPSLVRFVVEAQ